MANGIRYTADVIDGYRALALLCIACPEYRNKELWPPCYWTADSVKSVKPDAVAAALCLDLENVTETARQLLRRADWRARIAEAYGFEPGDLDSFQPEDIVQGIQNHPFYLDLLSYHAPRMLNRNRSEIYDSVPQPVLDRFALQFAEDPGRRVVCVRATKSGIGSEIHMAALPPKDSKRQAEIHKHHLGNGQLDKTLKLFAAAALPYATENLAEHSGVVPADSFSYFSRENQHSARELGVLL